jgi:hypothetical protein
MVISPQLGWLLGEANAISDKQRVSLLQFAEL